MASRRRDPLSIVGEPTKAAIRAAVREAIERGAPRTFFTSALRRELLSERAVRDIQAEARRRFDRDVSPAIINAVARIVAQIERPSGISIGEGIEIPPPPPRIPPQLSAAINTIMGAEGRGVWEKIAEDLRELTEQEVAFTGKAMVKAYGPEALTGPLSRLDPNQRDPRSGPLLAFGGAQSLSRQIVQQVEASPIFGTVASDAWLNLLGELAGRVERIVGTGLSNGETTDDIVRSLKGTRAAKYEDGILGKWSRHSVRSFVRTVATHNSAQARETSFASMGVPYVQLLATLDLRTSKICILHDHTVWALGQGPRPPLHPNCRTTVGPAWSLDGTFASVRASMSGPIDGRVNARQFFLEFLTPDQQHEIVPKAVAEALRQQKIGWRDLFDTALNPLAVRDLRSIGLVD